MGNNKLPAKIEKQSELKDRRGRKSIYLRIHQICPRQLFAGLDHPD